MSDVMSDIMDDVMNMDMDFMRDDFVKIKNPKGDYVLGRIKEVCLNGLLIQIKNEQNGKIFFTYEMVLTEDVAEMIEQINQESVQDVKSWRTLIQ